MKLRNILLKILLSGIAILPFWIIYLLSDFLFIVAYYVIRYRKKIVITNLVNSFPEKSKSEIISIAKKYYHNLCDLMMEVIKSQNMTRQQIEKRVSLSNFEVIDEFYSANKNVFALTGHCGNWEWAGNKIALFLKHEGGAIYKPIHDEFFNQYILKQRKKYKNTLMIDYKNVFKSLMKLRDKLYTIFVLADQSPPLTEVDYFIEFLGQKTAFYLGMEKVARALDYAVIYLDIQRVKRGYYQVEIIPITGSAKQTKEEEVTKKYVGFLEQSIRNNPDNWLWSHKRWKGVKY